MSQVHYAVVQCAGRWKIVGENLRFGAWSERAPAVRAMRRLAKLSGGLPVQLHIQEPDGALHAWKQVS